MFKLKTTSHALGLLASLLLLPIAAFFYNIYVKHAELSDVFALLEKEQKKSYFIDRQKQLAHYEQFLANDESFFGNLSQRLLFLDEIERLEIFLLRYPFLENSSYGHKLSKLKGAGNCLCFHEKSFSVGTYFQDNLTYLEQPIYVNAADISYILQYCEGKQSPRPEMLFKEFTLKKSAPAQGDGGYLLDCQLITRNRW